MRLPPALRLSLPARRIALGVLAVGSLGIVAVLGLLARLELHVARSGAPPPADTFVLPSPAAVRALAAGYTEAAADVVWTRMLVYYGSQTAQRRDPKFMAAYADAIASLDPYFGAPYAWAGHAIPLATTGFINPDNVETGIRFLRAGVARFPDDPELHGMLGYNLFYELPRWIDDDERIVRARLQGAEQLRIEAALGGGAPWMVFSATRALEKVNLDDLAARHLEESAWATDDPQLRQRILARLAELRSNVDVQGIEGAAATLGRAWKERFPYLPQDMFLLLSTPEEQAQMSNALPPGAPER